MAPACYVSKSCQFAVACLYNVQRNAAKTPQLEPSPSTQGLLKNKLWRSETKRKKNPSLSDKREERSEKKTPRLTHKRAIKITQQLPHSLTPATEKKMLFIR